MAENKDHCLTIYGRSEGQVEDLRNYLTTKFNDTLKPAPSSVRRDEDLAKDGYHFSQTIFFRDGLSFDEVMKLSDSFGATLRKEGVDVSQCPDFDRAKGWRGTFARRVLPEYGIGEVPQVFKVMKPLKFK